MKPKRIALKNYNLKLFKTHTSNSAGEPAVFIERKRYRYLEYLEFYLEFFKLQTGNTIDEHRRFAVRHSASLTQFPAKRAEFIKTHSIENDDFNPKFRKIIRSQIVREPNPEPILPANDSALANWGFLLFCLLIEVLLNRTAFTPPVRVEDGHLAGRPVLSRTKVRPG